MATSGTRNTALVFGDYEIALTMKKAQHARDLKLEWINDADEKVSTGGARLSAKTIAERGYRRAVRTSAGVVVLDTNDLKSIEEKSKQQFGKMRVLESRDYRQVPTERIMGSYWLQPAAGNAKGLRMIAEGLRHANLALVVQWVSSSAEKLGVVRVRRHNGQLALLLSEVAFADEFLEPDDDALSLNDAEVSDAQVDVATQLVQTWKSDDRAIDTARDTAAAARRDLFVSEQEKQNDEQLERSVGELVTEAENDGEFQDRLDRNMDRNENVLARLSEE